MEFLPEPPVHTGALVSTINIIKVHKLLYRVWILLKSFLVPAIIKSRSECPITPLFEENVEVLPEPPVHTGASATLAITIIKVLKLLASEDYVEVLPEPPVHTGTSASSAITIIKVASYLQVWILLKSYLSPQFIPGH